jgi:alanine racemase
MPVRQTQTPSHAPYLIRAEIDLMAIAHNVRELRRITDPKARLLVAVKANAYGHGAEQVARTALRHGASDLGVARIDEGLALRQAGIMAPILIFGYTPADFAPQLLAHDLVPTVYALEHARELAAAARAQGRVMPIHIKVDTGMGRLGIACGAGGEREINGVAETIERIARCDGLILKGLYTHFATADQAEKHYARRQFKVYSTLLGRLAASGLPVGLRHAANSGAIVEMPETHLDMVRAGISLYGLYPSAEVDRRRIDLKPALSLKARIIHLKQVPAGTCISYGCTYQTRSATTIATVPAGYADGYNRGLRVPIVGRVCMDLTMVDVGSVPHTAVGDEVVLIGRQNGAEVSADEVAETLGTINYEVVSALTSRVPRVYLEQKAGK